MGKVNEKEKIASADEVIESIIYQVQQALNTLASSTETSAKGAAVGYKTFNPHTKDGEQLVLPVDSDTPPSDEVSFYLVKQMEFIETFLIAHRLISDLSKEYPQLTPKNRNICHHALSQVPARSK